MLKTTKHTAMNLILRLEITINEAYNESQATLENTQINQSIRRNIESIKKQLRKIK